MQLLSGAGPVYPTQARAAGIEGFVEVIYDVSTDGRVVRARVLRSEPPDIFDEAALDAVRSWRFNAPRIDGKPVPAENRVSTVRFLVDGGERYENL